MNHSAKFYEHVLRVFPDYYKHHAWLKENGPEIMARGHGG
jgi:predicted metal-dependent hydrolase